MEAGVAVAFKKRWPQLSVALAKRVAERKLKLGEVFVWTSGADTVYGLVLQESETKKATMPALSASLQVMVELAAAAKIEKVALPRLGAGNADLDPLRVKHVLEKVGAGTSVTLLVYEQFVRAKTA
jgi:O-acetyl-ADP-ribose deacetylase (regulator of RNase III)